MNTYLAKIPRRSQARVHRGTSPGRRRHVRHFPAPIPHISPLPSSTSYMGPKPHWSGALEEEVLFALEWCVEMRGGEAPFIGGEEGGPCIFSPPLIMCPNVGLEP